MKPTAVTLPTPIAPRGNCLQRAWTAIVHEHRLPTGLSIGLERCKIRLGWRFKTVTVSGLRFRVRRLAADEHFIRDILLDKEYTPAGYEIGDHDVVVDIGGNVGSFTIYAASKAPRGRVVVLEPIGENLRLLIHNVGLNDLDNVAIRRAALVSEPRSVRVYLSEYGSGGHSVLDAMVQPGADFEEVDGITLADVFREYQLQRCDLLKMDCEGAEFQVLQHIDIEISQRIRRLVMEYHVFPDGDKHEQAGQLIKRLIQLGFTIDHYTDVLNTYWGMIYARRTDTADA